MSWDPEQYGRFADERAAPLNDLLAGIADQPFAEILDLGCGNGAAIPPIRARWPEAKITAVDNSAEMLAAAEQHADAHTRLIAADIAGWEPEKSFDLILSNALLHWLDNHAELFPRLMNWLMPSGCLAIQMPNNWAEPSHRLMAEAARDNRWREKLAPLLRESPVGDAAFYQDILGPVSQSCEVWEKFYTHKLTGEDAVYNWIKGTSLKPLLEALDGEEQAAFAARYKNALAAAYPCDGAGITEYPMRRLFIMAIAPD